MHREGVNLYAIDFIAGEGAAKRIDADVLRLEIACRFALRASALSVTRYGAQTSAPSRSEVDAFHP